MSTLVDERIVSIQFNNKSFEKNIAESMASLDKIKDKSDMTGPVSNLKSLASAAKSVDLSGISKSVEAVKVNLNAMDIAAVTALTNLANSAVNAGKRMVRALTVAPISQGYEEYELKLKSIQTIMKSTGASIEEVSKYLEELNEYSDRTIYSFSDMTSNIGKFTNAGVKLEDAVLAIKGVSNEAAVSGANANEASRAMYNFAQALSSGYVKLIDWKSIENANMATVEFKQQLIDSAVACGTLTQAEEGMYKTTGGKLLNATKNFNDTLEQGWMTTEVLVKTLRNYADESTDIGKKAYSAAQDVKSFTQLMDTLKEAVGSGWAMTFEIIFGNIEEAKKLWTGVNNVISPIIDAISDFRNTMLKGALSSKWDDFIKQVNDTGVSTDDFTKKIKEVASSHGIALDEMIAKEGSLKDVIDKGKVSKDILIETLKGMSESGKQTVHMTEDLTEKLRYFQEVVDLVWRGDYKNAPERYELLAQAGYDYAKVQDLVNKTVDHHRLTIEELSDTQLAEIGYTEQEIGKIRELAEQAEKAGTPLNKLINQLSKPTGREMLFTGISNVVQPVITLLKSLGQAWEDAFPPNGNIIYKFIEVFYELSKMLVISEANANKISRIFKGLFAVLDLGTDIVGGIYRVFEQLVTGAFKRFTSLIGMANVDLLEFIARIGDVIVLFRNWVSENEFINKTADATVGIIRTMVGWIDSLIGYIKRVMVAIKGSDKIQNTLKDINDSFVALKKNVNIGGGAILLNIQKFFKTLANVGKDGISFDDAANDLVTIFTSIKQYLKNISFVSDGYNIIQGLIDGIKAKGSEVIKSIIEVANELKENFKSYMGIHSPSTVFFEYGQNIIAGLVNGIQNGLGLVGSIIGKLTDVILGALSGLDFASVFLIGSTLIGVFLTRGIIKGFKTAINTFEKTLAGPLKGVTSVLNSFSLLIDSFAKKIDAETTEKKANAVYTIAKSIAVLAGAVAVLSMIDSQRLIAGTFALSIVVAELGAITFALSKIPTEVKFGKVAVLMVGIGLTVSLIAKAVKTIGQLSFNEAAQGIGAIIIILPLMIGMFSMINELGKVAEKEKTAEFDKIGTMFMKFAGSLAILAIAIKIMGKLSGDEMAKGFKVILGAVAAFSAITIASSYAGENADKAGKMFSKFSSSLLILAIAIKLMGTLSENDITNGTVVIGLLVGVFALLTKISKHAGDSIDKFTSLMFKFSASLMILVTAMKIIGTMSEGDIAKNVGVLVGVTMIFAYLTKMSKYAGDNMNQLGIMFLEFSGAMTILGIGMKILGSLSLGEITKATGILIAMTIMFGALTAVSLFAGQFSSKAGTMFIKAAVAIGVMAVALRLLAGLSMADIGKGLLAASGMIALFSVLTVASHFAGKFADSAGTMFIRASAAILILVGAIAILSLIDPGKVAIGVTAITVLMLAFGGLMALTNGFEMGDTKSLFMMVAVVGILATIVAVMSALNVEQALPNATALSTLLLALAVSMKLMDGAQGPTKGAFVAIGVLTLVIAALGGILYLLRDLPVETTLANAVALGGLLIALTTALGGLTIIGTFGPAALTGIQSLVVLVGALGGLMAAIGALVTYIPGLKDFLESGISTLTMISEGLGKIAGGFVNGLLTESVAALPEIANSLSTFMTNLQPFLEGSKGISSEAMIGVGELAKAIMLLTASDLLSQLKAFFLGGNSLDSVGNQLAPLGEGLKEFGDAVKDVDAEKVKNAADAAKVLAETVKTWPKGNIDLEDTNAFGGIVKFGEALRDYSNVITGNAINVDSINKSVEAGKGVIELVKMVPTDGGFFNKFTGSVDIGKFKDNLIALGEAIKEYSVIASEADLNIESVNQSVECAKSVLGLIKMIPTTGGFMEFLNGSVNFANLKENLFKLAEGVVGYASRVNGMQVDGLDVSIDAGMKILSFVGEISKTKIKNVDPFVKSVNKLAEANIKGIEEAFNADLSNLTTIGQTLVETITNGMTSKIDSIKNAATSLSNTAITTLSDNNDKYGDIGKNYTDGLATGISNNTQKVINTFSTLVASVITSLNGYYESFSNAGSYLVSGFASGISSTTYYAAAQARNMASAANNAARNELGIRSPSRVFREIGKYIPQGFALGIRQYSYVSNEAIKSMSDESVSNTKRMMRSLSTALSIADKFDTQPTIRPIVDLSNVQNGVDQIRGLMSLNSSIGLSANINGVNSMVSQQIQNGNNREVIHAIKELKNSMNRPNNNNVYNVNGVTYDDGTNVSNAVSDLVRAIKIERRK